MYRNIKIDHQEGQLCPACVSRDSLKKKGSLTTRRGKFGAFLACTRYPDCQYTCKITRDLHAEATRLLKQRKNRRRKKQKRDKRDSK